MFVIIPEFKLPSGKCSLEGNPCTVFGEGSLHIAVYVLSKCCQQQVGFFSLLFTFVVRSRKLK